MVVETTLKKLREATVAHTDAGPYYVIDGNSCKEVIVKGVVRHIRPALCYIDIDGESFTTMKKQGIKQGDSVNCRLSLGYENDTKKFTILSIEKS
ncbi:MAG: hypothetical protein ACQESE_00540 [Nanobdellota archaeon]